MKKPENLLDFSWGPSQQPLGEREECTLDRSPVHNRTLILPAETQEEEKGRAQKAPPQL